MTYFQEISFFHNCGHTENHTWSKDDHLPAENTTRTLPAIDTFFFNVLEEGGSIAQTTEVHYQLRSCSSCQGKYMFPLNEGRTNLIGERRALWHNIVSSFQLQFDLLDQAKEILSNKLNGLLQVQFAELMELHQRLENVQTLIGTEARRATMGIEDAEQLREVSEELMIIEIHLTDLDEEVTDARREINQLTSQKAFFQDFKQLRQIQESNGVPAREQFHMLAPGWTTGLLIITNAPLNDNSEVGEEESCSICRADLWSLGRSRSLPCKHFWHGDCIMPWLELQNACPMCRAQFRILRPPPFENSALVTAAHANIREEIRRASLPPEFEDEHISGSEDSSDNELDSPVLDNMAGRIV